MYARMTTFYIPIKHSEEAVEIFKSSVIPEAKSQKGFVGAYFLMNRNLGQFISLTMWENQDAAVENQKSGYYQRQLDKFEEFQTTNPDIQSYQVGAMECNNLMK